MSSRSWWASVEASGGITCHEHGKQASIEARGGITSMNMESRQVLRLAVESPL